MSKKKFVWEDDDITITPPASPDSGKDKPDQPEEATPSDEESKDDASD